MVGEAVAAARRLRDSRYADAAAVIAAGSIIRGEGSAYSDLDIVVIYPRIPYAYRESFRFEGLPVEAFIHDPETLKYFFFEVDRPRGIPALPQMVFEGIEIPRPTDVRGLRRNSPHSFFRWDGFRLDAPADWRISTLQG